MLARWADFARRARYRSPRSLVRRTALELRRQVHRPWSLVRPRLLTDRALLKLGGASSLGQWWEQLATRPFFVSPARRSAWSEVFRDAFPHGEDRILDAAERVLRHEFDLLGSGPVSLGPRIPWHEDFKSGRRWPLRYAHDIDCNELSRPSDVKVPWELSRCQQFALLGQAYWLSNDERFSREFAAEVRDWIQANPFGYGVNWACPMEVALRAINWVWGFYFMAGAEACRPPDFRSAFLRTLFLHGEFLAANTWAPDVPGNHEAVEATGRLVLGLFFGHTRPGAGWRGAGASAVSREVLAQVSSDGVHFEQSTAYHRLVLEAFLTSCLLLRLHREPIPPEVWDRLQRMHEFVCAYTKPDGRAPLIGDADDARVQKLGLQPVTDHRYLLSTGAVLWTRGDFKRVSGRFWEESFWLLGPDGRAAYDRLPASGAPASAAFPDGGFYVMRGPAAHLVIDSGEVGQRSLGGHGHNDILSFELHLNGVNLVTDCGSYLYTASPEWRNRFRSTAFHNTVQVDGAELNRFTHPDELWRLSYDAAPIDVVWRPGDVCEYFRAGHTGYKRLDPPVLCYREVALDKRGGRVAIRDRVEGLGIHRLTWRFQLDPAVRPELLAHAVRLSADGREAWFVPVEVPGEVEIRLDRGWTSPRYGVKTEIARLVAEVVARVPVVFSYLFADHLPTAEERTECLGFLG